VESSCELGNEPSGSIKCWETKEWLHNLWPLERYSPPQSQLCTSELHIRGPEHGPVRGPRGHGYGKCNSIPKETLIS
jgi:hypothetical protein